jgi:hypothetical protein
MVEKMTAVWLIILTIIVCAAVPAVMIWLTIQPKTQLILGFELYDRYALLIGRFFYLEQLAI